MSKKVWTFQRCIFVDGYKQGAKHIISTADALDCLCECMALTEDCWCVTLLDPRGGIAFEAAAWKNRRPSRLSEAPPTEVPTSGIGGPWQPGKSSTRQCHPAENPTTAGATVNAPAYMPHQAGLSLVANIAQISMPAPPQTSSTACAHAKSRAIWRASCQVQGIPGARLKVAPTIQSNGAPPRLPR